MPDIIFTAALILFTALLIALCRFAAGFIGTPCHRPSAELRLYFDENCECIEYTLGKIAKSRALSDYDLKIVIVDRICTEESRMWLSELKRKLRLDIIIETEADRDIKPESDG